MNTGKGGRYVIKKERKNLFCGVVRRRDKSQNVLGEWENFGSVYRNRTVRREQCVERYVESLVRYL